MRFVAVQEPPGSSWAVFDAAMARRPNMPAGYLSAWHRANPAGSPPWATTTQPGRGPADQPYNCGWSAGTAACRSGKGTTKQAV